LSPGIRRFTAEKRPYRLVVSSLPPIRKNAASLMAIENTHPLPELMAAVREHQAATGTRSMLA